MTQETQAALVIELEGETGVFNAHPSLNQYLFAKLADDLAGTGHDTNKAILMLAADQVFDEERERLEEFLVRHGRADDLFATIANAITACVQGETNLPLEQPQDSSPASETPDSEPESEDDSPSEDTPAEVTLEPVSEFPLYKQSEVA